MRHSEDEAADVVLARLHANKPSAPRGKTVAGRYVEPSAAAIQAYQQRLEAWQDACDREEKFKRGKRAEWDMDVRHGQALAENLRRDKGEA